VRIALERAVRHTSPDATDWVSAKQSFAIGSSGSESGLSPTGAATGSAVPKAVGRGTTLLPEDLTFRSFDMRIDPRRRAECLTRGRIKEKTRRSPAINRRYSGWCIQ
jgi:hypothetical protein